MAFLTFGCLNLTSCDDANDTTWEIYRDWREYNQNWLIEQMTLTNPDGTQFYREITMPTDPQAKIYMHNIGDIHSENLTPLYTSTTTVNYTLKMANDSIVDQAAGFVSQLNSSGLISGWGLAIMQLHVGDSAQFILPYNVAYGSSGSTLMPPYSNLQFNIRLVDIDGYEIRP